MRAAGVPTLGDKVAAAVFALSTVATVVVTRSQQGHMESVDAGSGLLV